MGSILLTTQTVVMMEFNMPGPLLFFVKVCTLDRKYDFSLIK